LAQANPSLTTTSTLVAEGSKFNQTDGSLAGKKAKSEEITTAQLAVAVMAVVGIVFCSVALVVVMLAHRRSADYLFDLSCSFCCCFCLDEAWPMEAFTFISNPTRTLRDTNCSDMTTVARREVTAFFVFVAWLVRGVVVWSIG
jgi:hypothetical protein